MQKIKRIADRVQYVLPSDKSIHNLAIIENQYPTHPAVIEAVHQVGNFGLYPHSVDNAHLVKAIAQLNNVSSDMIVLTNGSDNALLLIINAYCISSSVINIAVPTYPHFVQFAETSQARVNSFRVDILPSREVAKLVCGKCEPGLCYLVSPNMPMGYTLTVKDIEYCLLTRPDVLFIIDHAYVEYGGELATELLKYENIIITRTFSKAFGLAALRIGYMMSHRDNIKYLLGVVNEKNVTPIAVAAAVAALDNIDYYTDLVKETEREKLRMNIELTRVRGSQVYNHTISGGNFYLIYAKDPEHVCAEFKSRGIIIRNKSSEIPNAVRIMVGRPDQNDAVIDTIWWINLGSMLAKSTLIFDLDNTLRHGSKNSAIPYQGSKMAEHGIICTNNCTYTPEEISEWFAKHSIVVRKECIYSPLTEFLRRVVGTKYAVVGRIGTWFPDRVDITDADHVFIGCDYFLSARDMIAIVKNKPVVYYPYDTTYTTFDDYADSDDVGGESIPDVGSIINILKPITTTVMIGKPNIALCDGPNCVVIGDGESDRLLAESLKARWIDCKQVHVDVLYEAYANARMSCTNVRTACTNAPIQ